MTEEIHSNRRGRNEYNWLKVGMQDEEVRKHWNCRIPQIWIKSNEKVYL